MWLQLSAFYYFYIPLHPFILCWLRGPTIASLYPSVVGIIVTLLHEKAAAYPNLTYNSCLDPGELPHLKVMDLRTVSTELLSL